MASKRCNSILIIDDDDSIRETVQEALELEGFTVATATNGQEGIEEIPKMDTPPCLILLDLMMPVMDGWAFVDALEKDSKLAGVPVVVISAFTEKSKSIHAQRVVRKPFELDAPYEIAHKYCG